MDHALCLGVPVRPAAGPHALYGRAGSRDPNRRVWGKPKLLEAIQAVFEDPNYYGLSPEEARARALELIHELEKILGFRYQRRLVAVILESKYRGNRIEWVVNDPGKGIVISAKKWDKRELEKCLREKCKERCRDSDDEDKCVQECKHDDNIVRMCVDEVATWGFKWIAEFFFVKVRRYVDKLTHDTYYTVVIARPKLRRKLVLRYVKLSDIIETMRDRGIVDSNKARDAIAAILAKWPVKTVYDYITLGVVPDDEGRPRIVFYSPLGRYFKKYYSEVTKEKAREVYAELREFVKKWYGDSPKIWRAIAIGLFQGLNFFRKCHGLRNKLLLLAGEPETGKSTIGKMILMMYGLHKRELVVKVRKGAATVFSPARLARAVILTTFPILIDEGKVFVDKQEVAELIKNLTDSPTIYEVAKAYTTATIQYPAYAGLIVTTQQVHITDPGVLARFEILQFTASEKKPKEKQAEFNRELEQLEPKLGYVGAWYVKYLIEHWDEVRDIVLQGDYVKAAVEYFRKVWESLDLEPPPTDSEDVAIDSEYVDELERLRYEIYTLAADKALQLYKLHEAETFRTAIEKVIETNMLAGYGIRCVLDKVQIFPDLIHRLRLGSLKNIYEKFKQLGMPAEYRKTRGTYVIEMPVKDFVDWLLREKIGNSENS